LAATEVTRSKVIKANSLLLNDRSSILKTVINFILHHKVQYGSGTMNCALYVSSWYQAPLTGSAVDRLSRVLLNSVVSTTEVI